jgi:filamentous hemagglutinin
VISLQKVRIEMFMHIPSGKTGKLADGRNVNVRVDSSDGRPTLEIMNKNGTRTKVRYDD